MGRELFRWGKKSLFSSAFFRNFVKQVYFWSEALINHLPVSIVGLCLCPYQKAQCSHRLIALLTTPDHAQAFDHHHHHHSSRYVECCPKQNNRRYNSLRRLQVSLTSHNLPHREKKNAQPKQGHVTWTTLPFSLHLCFCVRVFFFLFYLAQLLAHLSESVA